MPWYRDLFSKEDPFREERYSESESSRKEVDAVVDLLGLQTGDRILDLCCGQGRHLIDLMRRGFDIVGVDLSEYMLSKCREAALREGLQPCLIQADMRDLRFDSEFDAVISMWDSFGYLESDEEDQKVLDGVSRALRPGGRFLLDHLVNRDSLMKRFEPRAWHENDEGDLFLTEHTFDSMTGRIQAREIVIRSDGSRSETGHDLRVYTFGELERMLRTAGMTVQSAWGDRSRSPFTVESRGMEIVAVKE